MSATTRTGRERSRGFCRRKAVRRASKSPGVITCGCSRTSSLTAWPGSGSGRSSRPYLMLKLTVVMRFLYHEMAGISPGFTSRCSRFTPWGAKPLLLLSGHRFEPLPPPPPPGADLQPISGKHRNRRDGGKNIHHGIG